jgi:hypothetical protein
VIIPKVEECAKIDNSDAAVTRSDQSGSDDEAPTTFAASAVSILWTLNISPCIFNLQVTVESKFLCQLQTLHFHS